MDFQNYDDYMRGTMGFSNMNFPGMNPSMSPNMMGCPGCTNTGMCMSPFQNMGMAQSCEDLERMYPDCYRVVFPMVVASCATVNINMPITEEMLNTMTDDIYDRAVADGRINIDINVEVESREGDDSRQLPNRPRRPRRRNGNFRDLIRILLLREFLRRRQRFPMF